ncbi:MAG TPA: hypothetical protein V6C72_01050, partial [Chroococcales cyanobacterium]
LRKIREDAQKVINDAATAAQADRNAKMKAVEEEGRKKLADAKQSIATEKGALIDSLVSQEMELVSTITQKLLGEAAQISLAPDKVKTALLMEEKQ